MRAGIRPEDIEFQKQCNSELAERQFGGAEFAQALAPMPSGFNFYYNAINESMATNWL
jgi:hypothetical protein